MGAAACMVCGSVDLVMDDDLFVCQDCGCKYTVEQVRDIIASQEGGQEKSQSSAADYGTLAHKALDEGDIGTAIELFEKAAEQDPYDYESPWLATLGKAYMDTASIYSLPRQLNEPLSRLRDAVGGYNDAYFDAATTLLSSLQGYSEYYTSKLDDELSLNEYEVAVSDGYRKLQALEDRQTLIARKMSAIKAALEMQCKAYDMVLEGVVDPYCVPESYMSHCRMLFSEANEIDGVYIHKVTPNFKAINALKKRYPDGGGAFWDERPEERFEIFERLKELERRREELEKRVKEADEENRKIREAPMPEAPSRQKVVQLEAELSKLEAKRNSLGLFRKKEKEAIAVSIEEKKKEIEAAKLALHDELRAIEEKRSKDVQEALEKNNARMAGDREQLQQTKHAISKLAERLSTHSA